VDRPLYSERAGRARTLNTADFAKLVWRAVIVWARERGLFGEAFERHLPSEAPVVAEARFRDVDAFLLDRLHVSDVSRGDLLLRTSPPFETMVGGRPQDLLFDLLELLHNECVSLPTRLDQPTPLSELAVGPFDQQEGQRLFRERLNPVLAKHSPPLVMRPIGRWR
jgi:hypothetical protein